MAKLNKRAQPLTKSQQRGFLTYHIPGRIKSLTAFLLIPRPNYLQLAAAAVLARATAGFLGLATRNGKLCEDHEYFKHERNCSWEVKISDLDGGRCLKLSDLTKKERDMLEAGINETNLAFAHLTFWDDPANQDPQGRATKSFAGIQSERIKAFAKTVVELCIRHTPRLPKGGL